MSKDKPCPYCGLVPAPLDRHALTVTADLNDPTFVNVVCQLQRIYKLTNIQRPSDE